MNRQNNTQKRGRPGRSGRRDHYAERSPRDWGADYADMDTSPTKAWLLTHRNEPEWKWYYEFAFDKRPSEELYDVRNDPDQVKNLAGDPAYAKQMAELSGRLMKLLTEANDPRVVEQPPCFEQPPFIELDSRTKTKATNKERRP